MLCETFPRNPFLIISDKLPDIYISRKQRGNRFISNFWNDSNKIHMLSEVITNMSVIFPTKEVLGKCHWSGHCFLVVKIILLTNIIWLEPKNYFNHKISEICQNLVIAFLSIFNMSPFKFYFIMFILFVTAILK